MVIRDDLALNHRDHCISTAEAEEADEEEGIEELEEYHSKPPTSLPLKGGEWIVFENLDFIGFKH